MVSTRDGSAFPMPWIVLMHRNRIPITGPVSCRAITIWMPYRITWLSLINAWITACLAATISTVSAVPITTAHRPVKPKTFFNRLLLRAP